jgi:hypothetical protein
MRCRIAAIRAGFGWQQPRKVVARLECSLQPVAGAGGRHPLYRHLARRLGTVHSGGGSPTGHAARGRRPWKRRDQVEQRQEQIDLRQAVDQRDAGALHGGEALGVQVSAHPHHQHQRDRDQHRLIAADDQLAERRLPTKATAAPKQSASRLRRTPPDAKGLSFHAA